MYLVALNNVDEVEQKITTTVYMKIVWSDTFMTWTPTDYGDITEFTVPQENIWKPDLALANAHESITGLGDKFMYLTVTNDGTITWEPFQVFDSTCDLDMTYFPFDKQTCDIQMATWSSTKEMVNIVTGSDGFNTDAYEENANWNLLGVSTYDSSTTSTSGLSFSIHIKRKPIFYLLTFMIPIVLLSILNNFVFVLPCDSGEKSGYAIILFLSFAIFLLIVTEIMPEGMNTIPVMSTYLLVECIFSTIIVVITIVQLRLHNQGEDTPVPNYFQVFTTFIQGMKSQICCECMKGNDKNNIIEDDIVEIPLESYKKKMNTDNTVVKATHENMKMKHNALHKEPPQEENYASPANRRFLRGARRAGNDEEVSIGNNVEHGSSGSSETDTELASPSAKTAFRLGDILSNMNKVSPDTFSSMSASVDASDQHSLSVDDVDDIDAIVPKLPPKMVNIQMGLRQNNSAGVFRPQKAPVPPQGDTNSVKSGEKSGGVTWPEVALALDNLFFVLFIILNSCATIIAFSVSGAN